jgi:hypothetical protein
MKSLESKIIQITKLNLKSNFFSQKMPDIGKSLGNSRNSKMYKTETASMNFISKSIYDSKVKIKIEENYKKEELSENLLEKNNQINLIDEVKINKEKVEISKNIIEKKENEEPKKENEETKKEKEETKKEDEVPKKEIDKEN